MIFHPGWRGRRVPGQGALFGPEARHFLDDFWPIRGAESDRGGADTRAPAEEWKESFRG